MGAVRALPPPAVETLVFRARAALRREYGRSGGSAASFGLLGLRLARLGLGRRRDGAVAHAAARDAGGGRPGAGPAPTARALPRRRGPAPGQQASAPPPAPGAPSARGPPARGPPPPPPPGPPPG